MASDTLEPRATNRFPHSNYAEARNEFLTGPHGARLNAAIEALYAAFASSKLSLPLDYCPHCFTSSDALYIMTTALRDLTIHDITFILPKATTTLGTDADFNYFLPRIFEAWALQAHYLLEALPARLKSARAAGWSDEQLEAVLEFVQAYIAAVNSTVNNTGANYQLDDILPELRDALPELPLDLKPLLNDPDAVTD